MLKRKESEHYEQQVTNLCIKELQNEKCVSSDRKKSTKYILSIISVCIARCQHISSHLLHIFVIKMDNHLFIFSMSFRVQLIQTNT